MIATVTLNAAIDKTYYVPAFHKGKVNRVPAMDAVPGGKGNNAAKVVACLREPCVATGFAGGANGQYMQSLLNEMGIPHDFVEIPGETRNCINIVDESVGSSTELLEPGPMATEACLQQFREKIGGICRSYPYTIMSGSLPVGVPADFYATLIAAAADGGSRVILDTSGDPLLHGAAAKPFAIKVNQDEAEKAFGLDLEKDRDAGIALLQKMTDRDTGNARWMIVTMGAKGGYAACLGAVYHFRTPAIEAVSAVGSGDAFAAGFAVACYRGYDPAACLQLAAACGAANAMNRKTGFVRQQDVEVLLPQVQVTQLQE